MVTKQIYVMPHNAPSGQHLPYLLDVETAAARVRSGELPKSVQACSLGSPDWLPVVDIPEVAMLLAMDQGDENESGDSRFTRKNLLAALAMVKSALHGLADARDALVLLESFIAARADTACECDDLPNSRHCPKHNEPIGEDAVADVVRAVQELIALPSNQRGSKVGEDVAKSLETALLRMLRR